MRKLEHYTDHELMVALHTNELMEWPNNLPHLPEFCGRGDGTVEMDLTMHIIEHIIIEEEMRSRWLVAHGGRA